LGNRFPATQISPLLFAPEICRSLLGGPAIGSARRRRPSPRRHLRLRSARVAGAIHGGSPARRQLREFAGATMVGSSPDMRGIAWPRPCGRIVRAPWRALCRSPTTATCGQGNVHAFKCVVPLVSQKARVTAAAQICTLTQDVYGANHSHPNA